MPRFVNRHILLTTQFKASLRQSGFSLLDLLVKLVFFAGLVAIATPIYFGYKQIQIWEAWTHLSYMAEICTNKAIKIKEIETCVPGAISSVSLTPLASSPHFIFDSSPTCTTNASTFTATGYDGEVKGETLSVTVTVGKTYNSPQFLDSPLRASARINHPVLLVFSVIFFVTKRVS